VYTRVNDIMWLDHGPGSSLDEVLLAASLKVMTTDQFLTELVVPVVVCEPICINQAWRIALLVAMSTLDDVNIAPMQRGDQSHGVVTPGAGGLVGAGGGHGRGGGSAGNHGGFSAGGRGGGRTGSFGPISDPDKGK
jgi:uncharacterized membrane protein YgcG